MNIFFSIVMPVFNAEKTLYNSVNSVLSQNYKNFELIIVNDGSTDQSLKILRRFKDSRIKILTIKNYGVSNARNRGIKIAKYKYISLLDADDIWLQNYLRSISFLINEYPGYSVFGTNYFHESKYKIEVANRDIPGFRRRLHGRLRNFFEVSVAYNPIFFTSSVTFTKEIIEKVDFFPVGVLNGEDIITWTKFALIQDFIFLNLPLVVYRYSNDSDSKRYNETNNYVTNNLLELSKKINSNKYILRWYEMLAISNLKIGKRKPLIEYLRYAIMTGNFNIRLLILFSSFFVPNFNFFFRFFKYLSFKSNLAYRFIFEKTLKTFFINIFFSFYNKKLNVKNNYKPDFVIEGYPRSGNTYLYSIIMNSFTRPLKVASHSHNILNVKFYLKKKIPTIILIRKPEEAIASYKIREPSLDLLYLFDEYRNFYEPLLKHRKLLSVISFDKLISEKFNPVLYLNKQFGLELIEHRSSNHLDKNLSTYINLLERLDSKLNYSRDSHISAPNKSRDFLKNKIINEIRTSWAPELNYLNSLYYMFITGDKN